MTPITYTDAHEAIRWGNAKAQLTRPMGIAYRKGEGWRLYDFRDGCPVGCEPEFVCWASGRLPMPISDAAKIIITQMLERSKAKA
jgi:hypothetical protein